MVGQEILSRCRVLYVLTAMPPSIIRVQLITNVLFNSVIIMQWRSVEVAYRLLTCTRENYVASEKSFGKKYY